jgi:hypothetical protein
MLGRLPSLYWLVVSAFALSTVACAGLVGADFDGYSTSSSATPGSPDGNQPMPQGEGDGQGSGGLLPDGGKKPAPGTDGGAQQTDAKPPPTDSGPTSCIGPKPGSIPQKLSTLPRAACTQAQATAGITAFKKPGGTLQDLYNAITSPTCRDCVFTPESASAWGPVVKLANGEFRMNWGHCGTNATGGSDSCGLAMQKGLYCVEEMCSTCATQATQDACWDHATANDCKSEWMGAASACPNSVNTECNDVAESIFKFCR